MERVAAHVFVSPAGSTRKAGRFICSLLEDEGYEVLEFDLGRRRGREGEVDEGVRKASLLVAGSPVYAGRALRPVMAWLKGMPRGEGKDALAYVSYGMVDKGSSLHRMAAALDEKGYRVQGLAEVLAEHSMMFRAGDPLGRGHPDGGDMETLRGWFGEVSPRLGRTDGAGMDFTSVRPAGALDRIIDAAVFTPQVMSLFWPPIRFREDRCIDCGACKEACPVGRLDGLPHVDEGIGCLYCYSCVRSCKQGAFTAPMWTISSAVRLLSRARGLKRKQATRGYS